MSIVFKKMELPLYDSPSYFYYVPIQDTTYKFKFQYNERAKQWVYDIYYADETPIIVGEGLVANFPILADYIEGPIGVLYLRPIGKMQNETVDNPYEIWKYFKLFYWYAVETEE